MYKLTHSSKILKRGEKIIIANISNGKRIQLSSEVFEIIEGICSNQKIEFENSPDKEFIEKVINNCIDIGTLSCDDIEKEPENVMASVELTHRCNLHCIHCCVDAQYGGKKENDLSTEKVKKILTKLIVWNPKSVMLSGGEPMLREDFFELAHYFRENYAGQVIVSTNGTLITEKNAKDLISIADKIDISIDGYNEQTCSKIRGKGVFDKVVRSVKILHENNFYNISLSMVISDKNEAWKVPFIELNKNLQTRPNCRIFSPTGRGKENKSFFTDNEKDKVFIPSDYIEPKVKKDVNFSCCAAGSREVFIDHIGDVYPCPSYTEHAYRLGNILEVEKLESLTKRYDHMDLIVDRLKEKGINADQCKKCCVNLFCWTCPGAVEYFYSQKALDYQCEIVKPLLLNRVWGQ